MNLYVDAKQFTKGAVFVQQSFIYEMPSNVSLADIMRPDYWKPVSDTIKRLAIITCIGGVDNIDVDLRCIGVGKGYCVMRLIRTAPSDESVIEVTVPTESRVEYLPGHQWCVIGEDDEVITDGYESRSDAMSALATLGIKA